MLAFLREWTIVKTKVDLGVPAQSKALSHSQIYSLSFLVCTERGGEKRVREESQSSHMFAKPAAGKRHWPTSHPLVMFW